MSTAAAAASKPKKLVITDVVEGAPPPAPTKPAVAPPPASPPKFVASQLLDVSTIEADPHNPRKDFPKEAMNELINSVMLFGVRQPIEVRAVGGGKHRIVFGERRYRAAVAAGLKQIPAIVRTETDLEATEVQLDENLKRADLSPLEVAGGYQRLLDLGRTMDQVCERSGKKRSAVYSAIALLKLGPEGRKAIGEELLEAETAKLLVKYVPKSMQAEQVKVVTGQGKDQWNRQFEPMSYREALDHLTGFVIDLKKAPFDVKSEALPCVAKSCAVCPNRAGNNPDLYGDVKPDTCVDREKYAGKLHLFRKAELEKKGVKLLSPTEAPVDELFWNTHGGLRQDSGYVEPTNSCDKDAQRRPYAQLLEPEQLKKLTVVALNHEGTPVELLKRAGLEKELKKAGKLTTWEQQQKKRQASAKKKETAAKEQGPKLVELVRDVLMGKCVAAVEDKGMLTSAMLKLLVCRLLNTMQWDQRLEARRGMKPHSVFVLDAKKLDKLFPKLTPGKLAGLVFETAFDEAFEVCDVDDMDSQALDACELLGVNAQKVADEVKAQREAQKAKAADKEPAKAKKPAAAAKKVAKRGGTK